ncbi:hypothetical protein [Vibrio parahaemolyticus]|uniref:hypothetical protein n=1 Tax=Vibrio parahaemolyticus TaxID=670 RepID=UPI0012AE2557|nr:hypothetical protein [Vibrio parahaemolyticus]
MSDDWFNDRNNRIQNWEKKGLSVKEAQANLFKYRSTIYPAAIEVAEFIFSNWGARMVAMLEKDARDILFEIWERELNRSRELPCIDLGGVPFAIGTLLRLRTNHSVTAIVDESGINFENQIFPSFSSAANKARPHTQNNGWIQWEYYCSSTSEWKLVDRLRKEYQEQKAEEVLRSLINT